MPSVVQFGPHQVYEATIAPVTSAVLRNHTTHALVSTYDSTGATTTSIVVSSLGYVQFYAPLGVYDLVLSYASGADRTVPITVTDATVTPIMELDQAIQTVSSALIGKQDASTAATDAELSTAIGVIDTALTGKQDASTAATDIELAAAFPVIGHLSVRPAAATFGRGYYWADDDNGGTFYFSNGTTWTKLAPGTAEPAGLELGYAEITAAPAATTSAALVDIAGLSVTVTVGVRPIRVLVNIDSASNSTAGAATQFAIVEGASTKQTINGTSGIATAIVPIGTFGVRLAPTPGQHTYKVQWARVFAGTSSMSVGAVNPASIQVVTC